MKQPKCVCEPDDYGHMLHCDYYVEKVIYDLRKRVEELETAITKHHSQKGMDMCWENDVELWSHVIADAKFPHETVPEREVFLEGCRKYYASIVQKGN